MRIGAVWISGSLAYIGELDGGITVVDMDFHVLAQLGCKGSVIHAHGLTADKDGNLICIYQSEKFQYYFTINSEIREVQRMKGTKFTFFGAMCVLVERSDGKKFLFDPYITENPQTDAPLEQFLDIDYLFVTHNAGDHFGDADVIMENAPKAVLFSGKDVNRHVQKRVPLPQRAVVWDDLWRQSETG